MIRWLEKRRAKKLVARMSQSKVTPERIDATLEGMTNLYMVHLGMYHLADMQFKRRKMPQSLRTTLEQIRSHLDMMLMEDDRVPTDNVVEFKK